MSTKLPVVSNDRLYDPAIPGGGIPLDTPAWLAWLEAPTTTRFSYPLHDARRGSIMGFMTVRKEPRQRGGTYWTIYRRRLGRLGKIYLGRSTTLTHARLEALAQTLRQEADDRHPDPVVELTTDSGGAVLGEPMV